MRLSPSAILAFLVASLLMLCASLVHAQVTPENTQWVAKTFYPATALLYSQDEGGDLKMRCTATAIEHTATGYTFVTAAHCACEDDTFDKTVSPEKTFFYITMDDSKKKEFMKATLTGCGYRHEGDDFAFFSVESYESYPTVDLGDDPVSLDPIVNVASPLGLGKQTFLGSVSSAALDRPVVFEDINWTHALLLQLFGTDGGSSGSAIVCLNQRKLCGLVVGTIDKTTIVGVPVSRLKRVKDALSAGTYKYWVLDGEASPKGKGKK